jgi:hypothetical protein
MRFDVRYARLGWRVKNMAFVFSYKQDKDVQHTPVTHRYKAENDEHMYEMDGQHQVSTHDRYAHPSSDRRLCAVLSGQVVRPHDARADLEHHDQCHQKPDFLGREFEP